MKTRLRAAAPSRRRRGTLIAKRRADGEFQWDAVLQGKNETVFFDF